MPSYRLFLLGKPLVQRFDVVLRDSHHHAHLGTTSRLWPTRSRSPLGSCVAVHTGTQASTGSFTTEPNVDIKSLKNTLEAHREVNRAPKIRKTRGKGHHEAIKDPEIGIPSIKISLPAGQPGFSYKRIVVPQPQVNKGTSRDLDALWRISDDGKQLPLPFRRPWLQNLEASACVAGTLAVERLGAEIRAFEKYSSPTQDEQRVSDDVLAGFIAHVRDIDPRFVVEVIGSRATGLADPLSDLDINIFFPGQWESANESTKEAAHLVLDKLHKSLRRLSLGPHKSITASSIDIQHYVKHARVPVLLCTHRRSGIPLQMQSTPKTFDSREYVKSALREYPTLKSLFKVLKQTLQMRGLTIGSSGGITSYPLLQMIVASLKFSEGRSHTGDVGNQFLHFLNFYSEVDFSTHGISIHPLELFYKSSSRAGDRDDGSGSKQDEDLHRGQHFAPGQVDFPTQTRRRSQRSQEYLMTLQDPVNPVNDLGRTCYQIKDVQESIIAIRAAMARAMTRWDQKSATLGRSKHWSEELSLLSSCIDGDYRVYEYERDDLRRLGKDSLQSKDRVNVPGD